MCRGVLLYVKILCTVDATDLRKLSEKSRKYSSIELFLVNMRSKLLNTR